MVERLQACDLCPRKCGVNRLDGELGFCQAGLQAEISYVGPHHGEEPPISGTNGSGTVFFKHCTMQCVFCQNWQISQTPPPRLDSARRPPSPRERGLGGEALAERFLYLQKLGVHNLNLVSPTQYVPQIVEALSIAVEQGFNLPIVYNTNGYESVEILKLLDGIIDIYLPDIKYADNIQAQKYSHTKDYVKFNRPAIEEMYRQVGLTSLIVRHLVLPEDISGSKNCLDFLAGISKDLTVSIMAQYSPQYKAERYPVINRRITEAEYDSVVEYAAALGLDNTYVQEFSSQEVFLPDFQKDQPFI